MTTAHNSVNWSIGLVPLIRRTLYTRWPQKLRLLFDHILKTPKPHSVTFVSIYLFIYYFIYLFTSFIYLFIIYLFILLIGVNITQISGAFKKIQRTKWSNFFGPYCSNLR